MIKKGKKDGKHNNRSSFGKAASSFHQQREVYVYTSFHSD